MYIALQLFKPILMIELMMQTEEILRDIINPCDEESEESGMESSQDE